MTAPPLSPEAERVHQAVTAHSFLTTTQRDDIVASVMAALAPDREKRARAAIVDAAMAWYAAPWSGEDESQWVLAGVCCELAEIRKAACPHHYVQRVSWQCERCGEAMGSDAP